LSDSGFASNTCENDVSSKFTFAQGFHGNFLEAWFTASLFH